MKNKFPCSGNCAFGRSVHQLSNGFDSLSVLQAQSRFGSFKPNVVDVDRRSGQGRERYRLADDGTAAGILRAIDFKHAKLLTLERCRKFGEAVPRRGEPCLGCSVTK